MRRGHLVKQDIPLAPGGEWHPPGQGWWLLTSRQGAAYWLCLEVREAVEVQDLVILPRPSPGLFLASQLGHCRLEGFLIRPDLLIGLLTGPERAAMGNQLVDSAPHGRVFRAGHPWAQRFQALVLRSEEDGVGTRFQLLGLFAEVFGAELARIPEWGRLELKPGDRFECWAATVTEEELERGSLPEFAARCGCSQGHFARLFRARFGRPLRNSAALQVERRPGRPGVRTEAPQATSRSGDN